jgi:hypothetical protein
MRSWWVVLLTVAACGFPRPQDVADDASEVRPDAPPEFGTFVKVGFLTSSDIPMAPVMWANNVDLNTDGSTLCNTQNNQAARYCVVVGTSITLASGATLRTHGSKALVLLATSTFDLQGTIDISSKHGDLFPGAGAAAAISCPNQRVASGNSGGYGGSFGGQGGDGGAIDGNAGIAASALGGFPTELRGGCPGGNGNSTTAGIIPAGGSGGGAVAIIADTIHVNGKINASGAGGLGGPAIKSGGGGGGSGGMIVLDAQSIVPGASPNIWLFANGGGGGQGGTGSGPGAGAGDDGQESLAPLISAVGGNNGNRSGGSGGTGSAGVRNNAGDADYTVNSGGGGAGGGGAGFIRAPGLLTGVTIAPPLIPQ